ncbi:MAG: BrnA antitoxin family protein [Nitrospirae bacterium]|nr:BrnA antitoxin family protein [Nitrospirota bacterium]
MKKVQDREDFELKKEYDFSKGIRGRFYRPKKVTVSLRLDDDVLLYFKRLASERKKKYQTLINEVLREYTLKA